MTIHVLLVDAHEEARRSLVRRLESDGRMAVAAHVSTVAEAGAAVRDAQIHLALMDVQSHNDESIARCQELRALTGVPIVVLVSFMTEEHWRALRLAGATDYLLKHANGQRLSSAIARLADRHQTREGAQP